MARKSRNYAAEYARRIENRMTIKGESRTAARGHVSKTHEQIQREEAQIRKSSPRVLSQARLDHWADKTTPRGMSRDEWRDILNANVENRGGYDDNRDDLADKLRRKSEVTRDYKRLVNSGKSYDEAADQSGARQWFHDRDEYDPIEIYWYQDS
jgi:hypothetical protein